MECNKLFNMLLINSLTARVKILSDPESSGAAHTRPDRSLTEITRGETDNAFHSLMNTIPDPIPHVGNVLFLPEALVPGPGFWLVVWGSPIARRSTQSAPGPRAAQEHDDQHTREGTESAP